MNSCEKGIPGHLLYFFNLEKESYQFLQIFNNWNNIGDLHSSVFWMVSMRVLGRKVGVLQLEGMDIGWCFSLQVISDPICNSLELKGSLEPARLLCPWEFSRKNTGLGCHFLLQGIIPTQIELMSLALTVSFFTTKPPG